MAARTASFRSFGSAERRYPGTGTDNLLVPPKLTAEQDKIYQALEKRRAATLISDIRRLENTDLPLFYAILMMSR